LSANTLGSRFDANSHNEAIIPSFRRDFSQSGLTLTFTQPVFRPQNWLQYEQGELQVRQAEAVFGQAAQDLILRVAQAYFDDLEAKRNRAAHLPTVDLVASQFMQTQSGSAVAGVGSELSQSTISLQLAVPLYAGGALTSREREAAANYEKSRQDLENARRGSA